MKRAGLPTPANHLIRSTADVSKAAEVVGFPAVIKPISGAASEGVVRVDSLEQLERCVVLSCLSPTHGLWTLCCLQHKPFLCFESSSLLLSASPFLASPALT